MTGNLHGYIVWDVSEDVVREVGRICRKPLKKGKQYTVAAIDRARGILAIYDSGEVFLFNLSSLTVSGRLGLDRRNVNHVFDGVCEP